MSDAPSMSQTRPSLYYGWIIVIVAFVTLGITFGIWYSYSVFILAVTREFNWSMASASSIFSIFILSHSFVGLAAGFLQDRFGSRIVVPVGALMLACALLLTTHSKNLWHFQISYGVFAGAGAALLGFVSHSAFLPKWFERKRGLALGIAMAGIGVGMLIMVPLAEKWISLFGWRRAYLYLAGMVLFGVAPLNLIFGRKSPQAIGQYPDGDLPQTGAEQTATRWSMKIMDKEWARTDWTLKLASRTLRFWFLIGAFFCISFAFQGVLLHSVAAMVDAGMVRSRAAFFFGLAGIMGSVGKILFGYLSDYLGRERSKLIADGVALLGISALMTVSLVHGPMAMIFGLFFGIGYGAAAPLIPAITADIFMGRNYGVIFALIAIGGGIGGATGTYVSGLLRDISGTYMTSLSLCAISLVTSCVLIFLAGPGKVRKMVRREQ